MAPETRRRPDSEPLRRLDQYEDEQRARVAAGNDARQLLAGNPAPGWPTVHIEPDMLSLAAAARITGLDASTLHTLRRRGKLECVKLGRDWFIPLSALRAYLEARRGVTPAEGTA